MEKVKYKFYYVNGQTEELETTQYFSEDAIAELRVKLLSNPTWINAGGKLINLSNVISIEVVAENEKQTLKPIKMKTHK
ncbi:hypothetical protein [Bacillus methanolicus]|uniref:Uncharacterized protein n=1 Tax=Bacillus methanolicus (strain MGA3 / ATCC 53907) TaxID=796606 RepID=I3E9E7_BACMM|nr:hypothetical protein [Bacillus methanolicus]AIE60367.1 hypothetical protein BMMGA3_09845 [Bacillus methanolicus MGA3]EIJ83118.1 hypothetical protein MGA3_07840 [Bacillus methanolicus MGA3]UQD52389.1 hypothetical protein C0971_10500 [Bacillus methanolicus]